MEMTHRLENARPALVPPITYSLPLTNHMLVAAHQSHTRCRSLTNGADKDEFWPMVDVAGDDVVADGVTARVGRLESVADESVVLVLGLCKYPGNPLSVEE